MKDKILKQSTFNWAGYFVSELETVNDFNKYQHLTALSAIIDWVSGFNKMDPPFNIVSQYSLVDAVSKKIESFLIHNL